MTGDFCSRESLDAALREGKTLLILDCRAQTDYVRSHIKGAINITLPGLMVRRLKKGNLKIQCIIQNNEAKERFNKLWKTHEIILYDQSSTDNNCNTSMTVDLLMKKLQQDGASARVLDGGFEDFEKESRDLCEGTSSTSEDTIYGLCNLKISDDSGNGTSESESETVNSPSPHSQYPVQVMPYLYLGNAQNSADLNQLKTFGIKYILNVTPNVPNKFEMDSDFKYLQIPVADQLSQNLSAFFPQAIAFIDEARENKCGVLVHCLAGISRSVTVTCAYLMQKQHISLNQAYDHVKQCKPNVSPNFNFLGQLLEFEKSILCQNSTQSVNEFHFHCNDNATVSATRNCETAT